MLKTLVGAILLAAATAVSAQAPAAPKADGDRPRAQARHDCSKAADPKACEERRTKAREAFKKARAACEKAGDRRACMTKERCAQAADPAKCEARAKARAGKRKAG